MWPGADDAALTVTVKAADDELPASSDAWQFTVVVPSGNVLPDAGEHTTLGTAVTASDAPAVYETARPPGLFASTVMLGGTTSSGAVVSRTVTVNETLF
jgi:hypothetical protein